MVGPGGGTRWRDVSEETDGKSHTATTKEIPLHTTKWGEKENQQFCRSAAPKEPPTQTPQPHPVQLWRYQSEGVTIYFLIVD